MLFRDHPPPHFHAGYGRPEALIEIATGRVRLWFTDGAVKDMDLSEALARGGVFEPMYSNRETFELSKRIALSQLCKHAVAAGGTMTAFELWARGRLRQLHRTLG